MAGPVPLPITAVVLTKNEEAAIAECLDSLSFCSQVIVVDSRSEDRTVAIAEDRGAEVLDFDWNGRYPKKKQWGADHRSVRNDWVLHIDADERVSPALVDELRSLFARPDELPSAFEARLEYHFCGGPLRHGHRVTKKFLVRRDRARFPEVDDLAAPGITEVEGHYQPVVDGPTRQLSSLLIHDDPDPIRTWVDRHNKYSDWEAHLAVHGSQRGVRQHRSAAGRIFDALPLKPIVFFVYAYVLRRGFLDGRRGFGHAFALTFYYWLIGEKTRELRERTASTDEPSDPAAGYRAGVR